MIDSLLSGLAGYVTNLRFWELVGWVAQGIFASRFLIQWVLSEKARRSYVPIVFWYISLSGGLLMLLYAVNIQAWPIVIGQATGVLVYARNLYLIGQERHNVPAPPAPTVPAPPTGPFDGQVTFVRTADLAAAHDFYAEKMGLPLVLDQGACRLYRVAPGAAIGLCTHKGPPPAPEATILTLVTDDVDGWVKRLAPRGLTPDAPPRDNPTFNIRHCFFTDPDGHKVEVQTFRDPAWRAQSGVATGGDD